MAHYVLPVPGEFYVVPGLATPFGHALPRGMVNAGRWRSMWWRPPGVPPTAMQQPAPQQQPLGNVSLSSHRTHGQGLLTRTVRVIRLHLFRIHG